MIWSSWTEFWAMGGYGLYVWGSFGVTALCVALKRSGSNMRVLKPWPT